MFSKERTKYLKHGPMNADANLLLQMKRQMYKRQSMKIYPFITWLGYTDMSAVYLVQFEYMLAVCRNKILFI